MMRISSSLSMKGCRYLRGEGVAGVFVHFDGVVRMLHLRFWQFLRVCGMEFLVRLVCVHLLWGRERACCMLMVFVWNFSWVLHEFRGVLPGRVAMHRIRIEIGRCLP